MRRALWRSRRSKPLFERGSSLTKTEAFMQHSSVRLSKGKPACFFLYTHWRICPPLLSRTKAKPCIFRLCAALKEDILYLVGQNIFRRFQIFTQERGLFCIKKNRTERNNSCAILLCQSSINFLPLRSSRIHTGTTTNSACTC